MGLNVKNLQPIDLTGINVLDPQTIANKEDKFAVIVSKFNQTITDKLLVSCIETLKKNGAGEKKIDVIKVPGAFEIPTAAKSLLDLKKYNAIICLGCVIRGETPHFDYICSAVSNEIAYLGVLTGIPIIFGVITCNTLDEAENRAGGKAGNKGSEAAEAAIEMVNLCRDIACNVPTG